MRRYRLFHHRILLYHLPVFVDGPASLAAAQGYAAIPAARLFSCSLCPFEGLFGVLEIVGDHVAKLRNSLARICQQDKDLEFKQEICSFGS